MDIAFGTFRLNTRERQVIGPDGPAELSARSFDILQLLLASPHALVSKDAIFSAVWPGVVVEENTLQVHVSSLRKILGNAAITTVHGRGYKYSGPAPSPVGEMAAGPLPAMALPGNLKRFRSECIARETELAAISELVRKHRLTSIVGPGGVGKTTVAMEVAARLADDFPGGIWVVDLAPVTEPEEMSSAFVQAMSIQYRKSATLQDLLAEHLATAEVLLVLDNCEHLVEPLAEVLSGLLADRGDVKVLLTSQVPLMVAGERVYRLHPFGQDADASASQAFFAYCYESQGETLTDADAAAVARLCLKLDGVALALKMAAARAVTLGVEVVDRQLASQLSRLSAKWNAQPQRHQSLLASLDWSYGLLSAEEQKGFRALGVFSGSFSSEAASAVMADVSDAFLPELLRRSLAVRSGSGRSRYRLLETSRLFALDQLQAHGEHHEVQTRHADFLAGLLAQSLTDWETTADDDWLARYGPDIDNVRAAFDWSEQGRSDGTYLLLVANAYRLWQFIELPEEGLRRSQRALAVSDAKTDQSVNASVRQALAELARSCAYDVQVLDLIMPAIPALRMEADKTRLASALILAANQLMFFRGIDSARPYFNELGPIMNQFTSTKMRAWIDVSLGMFQWLETRDRSCLAQCEAGLSLHRRLGSVRAEGRARLFVEELLHQNGENALAIELSLRSLEHNRATAHRRELIMQYHNLACYYLHEGDLASARPLFEDEMALADRADDSWHWCTLQNAADVAAQSGELERAARLLAFADRRFDATPDGRQETEAMQAQRLRQALEQGLDGESLARHRHEGSLLSIFEADHLAGFAPKRK